MGKVLRLFYIIFLSCIIVSFPITTNATLFPGDFEENREQTHITDVKINYEHVINSSTTHSTLELGFTGNTHGYTGIVWDYGPGVISWGTITQDTNYVSYDKYNVNLDIYQLSKMFETESRTYLTGTVAGWDNGTIKNDIEIKQTGLTFYFSNVSNGTLYINDIPYKVVNATEYYLPIQSEFNKLNVKWYGLVSFEYLNNQIYYMEKQKELASGSQSERVEQQAEQIENTTNTIAAVTQDKSQDLTAIGTEIQLSVEDTNTLKQISGLVNNVYTLMPLPIRLSVMLPFFIGVILLLLGIRFKRDGS